MSKVHLPAPRNFSAPQLNTRLAKIGLGAVYAGNFAGYDKTYGALGAVIALMTWLWLSATVVLIGAELNNVIESEAS